MVKGDVIENIRVDTMAAEGKCVAKVDGLVIFLEGCAPGDLVNARLTKIKSSFLEGKVTDIIEYAPDRTEPFCIHFGLCGGCSWQHIRYETQLRYKQKQVVDNLERIGGLTLPEVTPIYPSSQTRFYRNKLDFTFSAQRWLTWDELETLKAGTMDDEPALGYHIPRKYDKVFDVNQCHLQPDPSNAIRLATRDEAVSNNIPFFDLRKQIGFLRTLTIRTTITGEVMVILQVTYDKMEWIEKILTRLEKDFPQITSFQYVINGKKNDTFNDMNIICWKGNPYITEKMSKPDGSGELQFRVGPKSFYQTNSEQAYHLYRFAAQMAGITSEELVYDLYTGTGTIANFVAGQAKKVVGLEYVADAIADAKTNSSINNITNTDFYSGDIKDLLNENFLQQHGRPDVVITDPPRAGMHEDVCKMLLQAAPKRIVYVSCNAATQARDLKILSDRYKIVAVQPVDMFPHTVHVENIVSLLQR
ncbi:MAG: 23S rRNA (uracil(1939)-C(5))-methyltransferase RlmD [Cyclobacteriaceae bacterium]